MIQPNVVTKSLVLEPRHLSDAGLGKSSVLDAS